MANIDSEFNAIANDLTKLYQDEIKRQGLIESGKLLNSISFKANKIPSGYSLDMTAVDYFEYIDKKYQISKNVFKSIGYKNVQTRIQKAYNLIILEAIKQNN